MRYVHHRDRGDEARLLAEAFRVGTPVDSLVGSGEQAASVLADPPLPRDTRRAVSQENVEIVRRVLVALASGDRERMVTSADPQIVVDASRNVFNPQIYEGIEGLRRMLAAMDDAWEKMHIEPLEFIDAGERVAVVGRLLGKGRGSGVEVTRPNGQVWTVRAGLVIRVEYGFTSRQETLEALGLRD